MHLAFFSIVLILFMGSFFEHALNQINNYNVLNTKRFGTIGSAIFSLPIYLGFIPRMIYLFFTPVPNFSGIHQVFLSISAFMQVFSFPYLIFALKQKNIDNYNKAGKIYVPVIGKIFQTFLSIFDFIKLLFVKEINYVNHVNYKILEEKINLNERI